jgi:hypothetical protein
VMFTGCAAASAGSCWSSVCFAVDDAASVCP